MMAGARQRKAAGGDGDAAAAGGEAAAAGAAPNVSRELGLFLLVQLACGRLAYSAAAGGGGGGGLGSTPFLPHPATGWVALALLSPILLLGRQLSAGGTLGVLMARWRRVHVSRLPTNSHVCVLVQRLRHPLLDTLCRAFGFCAEEDFYMVLAPICWWLFPFLQPFFFNLMLVTLLGLLVGDALKDLLYVPRPSHPLLWTHSHSKGTAQEYGMPSTHAMNAVSNSLVFAFCAGGECGEHAVMALQQSTLTALAIMWVCGLCCSRIYLGVRVCPSVRSPADCVLRKMLQQHSDRLPPALCALRSEL
jgi:membrane-associated phospholipid phosphatase